MGKNKEDSVSRAGIIPHRAAISHGGVSSLEVLSFGFEVLGLKFWSFEIPQTINCKLPGESDRTPSFIISNKVYHLLALKYNGIKR